ncbi:Carbamoyltransferase [Croceitalea dokdonensis DOKDO 023]|uniref:Carbamoyltransferase n=1 Tax=Croceitalea dokdonensis DOKDO 023 TaxID=1300341 RepID=A0A0N8H3E7_9FLAO|nr:carbamoyltransferase C-terminal domain-containing protein [Croceitalea dokdonensis]KPM30364.1 Carbamoyltransferase [Croceitalea dokdonensis DOKDO 023]
MIILGLNTHHADSSAAIFLDGKLIAATEEERFTRVKHWAGFPAQAIQFCLQEANTTLEGVDHITIGRDAKAKLGKKMLFALKNLKTGASLIQNRWENRKDITSIPQQFADAFGCPQEMISKKLVHVEHHRAHLASAFFASHFEEAALLSIDGSGDFTTCMYGYGKGNQIEVLDSIDYPVSLGFIYTAFTHFLGFPHYGDEYKVMGLAPYGQPTLVDKVRKLVTLEPNGRWTWANEYFGEVKVQYVNNQPVVDTFYTKKFEELFGPARKKEDELTQFHKDLAKSVQVVTEEIIFHMAAHLQEKTGSKNLCIAGGVAQNSVANGKIIANTNFDQLYIPSAGHDAGISMGSALFHYHHNLNHPRKQAIQSASTGSRFTNEEIEAFLKENKVPYKRLEEEELYDYLTDKLIEPAVIGWFQGRAEFGPRALGNRSIIADPRNDKAKELLNLKIKRRESFRPFAPSILKEYVPEYFEYTQDVPFMEKVFPIKAEKHKEIPAVTHVDGTGRLQSVDKQVSPRYYRLIDTFRKKTGVPILLNTSFNENEPIVNSPAEAYACFARTQMDVLVMENMVVER